ncbi:hypothetical protein D3C78_1383140 [compost metagenome]
MGDPALEQHPKATAAQVLIEAAEGLVGTFMMGFADQGDGFERRIHRLSGLGLSIEGSIPRFGGDLSAAMPGGRIRPGKAAKMPVGSPHWP